MRYGEKAVKEAQLETWENPYPDRDYLSEMSFPEFSCLCPRSGYPDYAIIRIAYIPDRLIIELKSLKLYLNRYREEHISHEAATNKIYDDLSKTLKPRFIEVTGDFNPRGNLKTTIRVSSKG
ncbi:MAG: preQ(1) synthase [Thermodesulfobacteriota bacterium]